MKLYKTTAKVGDTYTVSYQGTQAAAIRVRQEWRSKGAEVDTQPIIVPTSKSAMLWLLNERARA